MSALDLNIDEYRSRLAQCADPLLCLCLGHCMHGRSEACANLHVTRHDTPHTPARNDAAYRLRRTSFFGGSVSTRKEAAAPGWKAKKPGATGSGVWPSGRQQHLPVPRGKKPGQPGLKRLRDEPAEDDAPAAHARAEAKRRRLAYARDYGALQARVHLLLIERS